MATARENRLRLIEDRINALGEGTPEYHEALAFYLTIAAKRQWIMADQARRSRERAARRTKVRR